MSNVTSLKKQSSEELDLILMTGGENPYKRTEPRHREELHKYCLLRGEVRRLLYAFISL